MSKPDLKIGDRVLVKGNISWNPWNGIIESEITHNFVVVGRFESPDSSLVKIDEIEPIVLRNGYLIKV